MAIHKTDPLIELLQALTTTEKRYITLFITRHYSDGNNKQLQLFRSLSGKPGGDAGAAEKQVKTVPAGDRSALFRTVLLAMRVYHDERSVDTKIREYLIDAEFLFEKRLYDSSIDLLKKAAILADRYERRQLMHEILQQEAQIIKEKETQGQLEKLEQNHNAQVAVLRLLDEETALNAVRNHVFALTRRNMYAGDATPHNSLPDWIKETPELLPGKSFTYNYQRLSAMGLYHTRTGNYAQAGTCYDLLCALWDKYPERKDSERLLYKKMLANSINVYQLQQQNDRVETLISMLKNSTCRTAEEEAEQFQVAAFAELLLLMNSGQWKHLKKNVQEIEKGLVTYKNKINKARELSFRINIAMAWFILHEWKEAEKWLVSIIEQPKTDHRHDIQHLARLFRLVLLYELNKHDLLEYELINTERYLRQRKAWFAYEAAVVKFIRKLLGTDEPEKNKAFETFHGQLLRLSENNKGAPMPGISELRLWIKHRHTGKTMRVLLHEEI